RNDIKMGLPRSARNAHRGKMRKAEAQASHPPIIEDGPTYVLSKGVAEMIHKVYEIDPLLCPSCVGNMWIFYSA
ncbi:MAG: hypothetical protein KAV87_32825, partial [Desulfobacteraceae bacterium]|nr:hypothetical protein [Desulfobacteraceae bacterium]